MSRNNTSWPNKVEIHLTDREMFALQEMAKFADMSENSVLRQALRLYNLYQGKAKQGLSLAWQNPDGTMHQEPVFGCPDPGD